MNPEESAIFYTSAAYAMMMLSGDDGILFDQFSLA
jgi:hypothetical protein